MSGLHLKSRTIRTPVSLTADVSLNGQCRSVDVSNLTVDGCCINGTYRIGEWLIIKLPRTAELKAQVRWTIWNRSGLRFDRRLGQ
jgi:hypothetical protein